MHNAITIKQGIIQGQSLIQMEIQGQKPTQPLKKLLLILRLNNYIQLPARMTAVKSIKFQLIHKLFLFTIKLITNSKMI